MNAAYTSQTCSVCGVADAGSQAEFRCVACVHARNADIKHRPQYFGVGDWGNRTARGVYVGDPCNP